MAIASRRRRPTAAERTAVPARDRQAGRGAAASLVLAPEARHEFTAIPVTDPHAERVPLESEPGIDQPAAEQEQTSEPTVEGLIELATAADPLPLPHRPALERHFGRSLGHIAAYAGPEAGQALEALGAEAASFGQAVLFADTRPDIGVVAHEVAHALQSPGAGQVTGIAEPGSDAEVEAAQAAAEVVASPAGLREPPVEITRQLEPGQLALQRADALPSGDGGIAVLERPIEPPSVDTEAEALPAATVAPAAEATAAGPQPAAEGEPLEEAEGAERAGLELPPAPEPGVTAEDVAAREAALAEAEAALAGATDVPGLLGQFAAVPPTVKALNQGQIAQNAGDLAAQESQRFEEGLPDIHATMSGDAAPPERLAVESPPPREVVLEQTPPPPAPAPDIPETPDPGHFTANQNVTRVIDQFFGGAETADRAEQIGESLSEVSTTDPELPRSPGPPPSVPLEGESDPARLGEQEREAVGGARTARDEAQVAVVNGPGPELAQPVRVDEAFAVEGLSQPAAEPIAPAEGAQAYLSMGMPPEVQTAFDQQQQQAMEASMAGAVTQAEQAATERDTARQAEVEATQEQAASLSREADTQQRGHVAEARDTIQEERRATLQAQSDAVSQLETDVDTRRRDDRDAIDTRVRDDQQKIDDRYETAEFDISTETRDAERDAREEKRKAEEAAEEESWWDKAVSFVRSAFNALVSAINSIFDAVRSVINGILDAVKAFAIALIDAAAAFIKGAIAAFGEFLKFAVDGLLGDIFPGLAAALNRKIDEAVSAAQGLVDTVANGLKAGVAALVDGLKAGLNRILDVFQAGLNTALALVEAALTGDWSALARKLLEAVLQVIGVDPESFYAFIGRAEETFQLILDNPMQFLGNVVDAFLGGVRLFAENIVTHLQSGIIGWLTGTLGGAGITLPERFDLMGVLSLAQQILGLTWERLRQKAVRLVGEANVARLEHVLSYIGTLVTEGWSGLWERIQADLGALRDQVLEGIKSFLMERVILAAITKIASLFNPVGAIVQIVLTAWNLYTFLRDQLQRIFQVVQAVVDAIGDIARGVLRPGMERVEQVLASLLPLALDLLARLLGLGNVGAKVREIIERIQATIDRAIDRLLERILAAFRGGRAAATDPASRRIQEEAAQDEAARTYTETFSIGTEPHTLRAVFADGRLSIKMASEEFVEVPKRAIGIQRNYIGEGKQFHPDTYVARELVKALETIVDRYRAIEAAARAETDAVKSAQIVNDGLDELHQMFARLGEYPFRLASEKPYERPQHRVGGLGVDGFGRAQAYWGRPVSSASYGKGGPASVDPPGIRILEHVPGVRQYQRGHLVAGTEDRSLGGPGNRVENLVPLAQASNTEMRDGAERDARNKIYDMSAHPPYILDYTAKATYGSDAGLNALMTTIGAPASAVANLFRLAQTNADLTDGAVQGAIGLSGPGAVPPTTAQLIDVRKELARAFMPASIRIEIAPLQGPVLNILPYTVLNHRKEPV